MSRPPSHRYHAFVNSFQPAVPLLPIMHTCFGRQFLSIMETRQIQAAKYDLVTERTASFHFYGKPSYRPKSDGSFSSRLRSALYCFILDYSSLPAPDGVLPFDSGGYGTLYSAICDDAAIEEFYLPNDHHAPARLVSAIFGSNLSYFNMRVRQNVEEEISKLDFHTQGILDICNPHVGTDYDQRAASVELHYASTLTLTQSNLLAIIAPDSACDDSELRGFAEELSADLVPYDLDFDNVPARQRQVRDATKEWLLSKGFI